MKLKAPARAPATASAAQLTELATEIQDEYALCEQAWQTAAEHAQATMEHARAVGAKLLAAKKLVGHGRWEFWVEAKLPFSIDKAERMMRLHKNWDRLKSAPEPILGIKQAVAYLTAENKKVKPRDDAAEDGAGARKEAGTGRPTTCGGAAPPIAARVKTDASTCPNCGCGEFDEDGDCMECHEPAVVRKHGRVKAGPEVELVEDEDQVEDADEVEDDEEPQSVRDFYTDPAESDFFCPEEPFDEDTADRLEVLLESMERPLSLMLENEAVAALSDFDPLKSALVRLERTWQEVSASLERKRATALAAQ